MKMQISGDQRREIANPYPVVIPAQAGIQYQEAAVIEPRSRGVLDTPPSRGKTA
jgi:hypothetical protein